MYKKLILISIVISLSSFARDINLDSLIKKASSQNKNLFLFIHTTHCPYCENMLEFTLDDEKIKNKLKKDFIYEHINVRDGDNVTYQDFKGSGLEFAQATGYDFYPSSLFFGSDTKLIFALPGYLYEDRFYKILNFITTKSYLKTDFHTYEKMSINHDK
jgi:thioredoxin-related protein